MGEDRKPQKTQAELKQERLAAALRENLKRRKAQSRGQAKALTVESAKHAEENSSETLK